MKARAQGIWVATSHLHSSKVPTKLLRACAATPYGGSRPSDHVLSGSEGLDHAEGPPACFAVASGGGLTEGYDNGGSGVCLDDGQTEAYWKDMDMTGLASASLMARRKPK